MTRLSPRSRLLRTCYSTLAITLAAGCSLASPSTAQETLTAPALMTLDRVSDVTLSPDGQQLAYTLTESNAEDFSSTTSIFVAPSDDLSAATAIVTDLSGGPQLRWAPDSSSIFYLSSQTGSRQLWSISLGDSSSEQRTDLALGIVAYEVSASGEMLLTVHDASPDCLDLSCSAAAIETESERLDSGLLYNEGEAPRFYNTYGDDLYHSLFTSSLTEDAPIAEVTAISPGYNYDVMENAFGLQWDFSIAPDDETVYFATRPSNSNQGDEEPKAIYVTNADGSAPYSRLISDPEQSIYNPRVSPDGSSLAYIKADGTAYTSPRITFWIRDLETGEDRQIASGLDRQVRGLEWAPDGQTLYTSGTDHLTSVVFILDANDPVGFEILPAAMSTGSLSAGGNLLAYTMSSMTQSPEIVVVSADAPENEISRSDFAASGSDRFALGETETFEFLGWNDEMVEGIIVKPANFIEGETYPVILNMHGGPNGAYADRWNGFVGSEQLLAANGYVVVMMNPHGSSGRGTEFGQSVLGHWGDRPLEDLQAGWNYVLENYDFIDENRACAMGGSYGGYLTLLIAGQWPEPWNCLVERAGIMDARSLFYSNDITAYNALSFVEEPWLDDSYESQNPVNFVRNWTVPIFIFAGDLDYRVPLEQSISAYGAARLMEVESQFLYFPDEAHGIRKPHNALRQYDETMEWLERWTAETGN